MSELPVNLRLRGRLCLVIGGGNVAVRKVETMLNSGALVRIVSPVLVPRLHALVEDGGIEWEKREWREDDLEQAWLVIAATDDRKTNQRIAQAAAARRLWVNAVDDPDNCSLTFPSSFTRGDLMVAVSTSGKSPALARKVRESIGAGWSEGAGRALDWISDFRDKVKASISDPKERFRFWDMALSPQVVEMIRLGKVEDVKASVEKAFEEFNKSK